MKKFRALRLSDVVFIMLKNVKMPTIVGILTCMSRINFVLSWVEYKKFYNLEACFSIRMDWIARLLSLSGSIIAIDYMNAHILLNVLNSLQKSDSKRVW